MHCPERLPMLARPLARPESHPCRPAVQRGGLPLAAVVALVAGGLGLPAAAPAIAQAPAAAPEAASAPVPAPAAAPRPTNPEVVKAARAGLARVYASFAGKTLRKDELALADLELSLLLGEQATELNPDDVYAWRAIFGATLLSDGTDEANAKTRSRAMERILALDPNDEGMKLRRLVEAIEVAPTAEERIARFEAMLRPANRNTIGPQIAAQLALKLALLYQRTGDVENFERWLGEAVTIDPASPAATAMAAGYFRFAADEVPKEAELLLTAMTANPQDKLAMRGFATLLLDRGAYRGAARFLQACADFSFTELPLISYDELLADVALALWASDQPMAAEELLASRYRRMAEYFRRLQARDDPSLLADPKALDKLRFGIASSQAVVRYAIVRQVGTPEQINAVRSIVDFSFENQVSVIDRTLKAAAEADKPAPDAETLARAKSEQASVWLQAALFSFWLAEDGVKGDEYVKKANAIEPLSEAATARFAAWAQLRSAEPAKAVPMFEALAADAENSTSANTMGLALAQIAAGDLRAGARSLLTVWQDNRGSLLGIDARARLAKVLGTDVPNDEVTTRLETLAAAVPQSFDRMFRPGARPITARLRWGTRPTNVLDSIPVTLEITNSTPWPLAVTDSGPIKSLVNMQGSIAAANRSSSIDVPSIMVSIDRFLSLPPRSTISMPIDLAYTEMGIGMLQFAQQGCTISLRAMVNWETTVGGFRAGEFGDQVEADLLRVEGMRLTDEWIGAVIQRARDPQSPQDIIELVGLVGAAVEAHLKPKDVSDARKAQFAELWKALPEIMAGLDPVVQSWLLVVMPDGVPPMEPTLEALRESKVPLVRLSYLVRRANASSDPLLDVAIASGDERIARYGRVVKEMLLHDEEVTRRDFNLGTGGTGNQPNAGPADGSKPAVPPSSTPPSGADAPAGGNSPTTPPPKQ